MNPTASTRIAGSARRSATATTFLYRLAAALAVLTLVAGCAIRLIGDYDDTIDQGVTDVQQRTELYFAKLRSDPLTPYDASFYDDIAARLAVLKTRAAALAQYKIIGQQLGNMKDQFDTLRLLDKSSARPVPPGLVDAADNAISVSVESILKLELALKRGEKPASN